MKIAIGPSSFGEASKEPIELLEKHGIEIIPNPYGRRLTEDEIIDHLKGADGLIAGLEPLNKKVLDAVCGGLKAIARVGIGMNNVDISHAESLGIKVSNTPDGPTESVAEMTLTALLSLIRMVPQTNQKLHQGEWKKYIGRSLNGLNVGIIGYGRIGRKFRKCLMGFACNVYIYDPFLGEDEDFTNQGIRCSTIEELLEKADIISFHAAGAEEIIGTEEISKMKDGVIILNSARGELINEEALINGLESGKIQGLWLDAFWQEPYKGKLTEFDNVLLTPHIGTYTEQCRKSMEVSAVNNILRDLGVR